MLTDYVDIQLRFEDTLKLISRPPPGTSDADLQAARVRLGDYSRTVPRLLQLLPGVFTDKTNVQSSAALAIMLNAIHGAAKALLYAGTIPQRQRPAISRSLVDVDRLHLLQDAARDSFLGNLESCVEAV